MVYAHPDFDKHLKAMKELVVSESPNTRLEKLGPEILSRIECRVRGNQEKDISKETSSSSFSSKEEVKSISNSSISQSCDVVAQMKETRQSINQSQRARRVLK